MIKTEFRKIEKISNSFRTILPLNMIKEIGLKEGDYIKITCSNNKIHIEGAKK